METICKTPAETSKRIKAELKAAFPETKFSVRSETFSMGNAVRISWSFGPTDKAVCAIVKKYEYGRFDGMTDSSWTEETMVSCPDGEVRLLGGAKYITTSRNFQAAKADYASEAAFWERVQRDLCALQGIAYEGRNTKLYANGWSRDHEVESVAYRVIASADLTKGYNGLRRAPDGNRIDREPFEVITTEAVSEAVAAMEVSAEAVAAGIMEAVKDAPAEIQEIASGAREAEFQAAEEIIRWMGRSAFTMSAAARRGTVFHRAYVRYPHLDRQRVLSAVLARLLAEVTI